MVIEPHSIWIGDNHDSEQLLGFGDMPAEPPHLRMLGDSSLRVSPMIPIAASPVPQRLTALLSHALQTQSIEWHAAPVVVLLPQLGSIDQSQHPLLFGSVCEAIPALSSHPSCYLYPYGRGAMLLAWKRIDALLADQPYVWVLAVDCDPRLCEPLSPLLDADSADHVSSITATDSVMLVKVSAASEGLQREWFSYEALTKDKATHTAHAAVGALFSRYQHACGLPIHQFYAPYLGGENCNEEWAMAYHHLDRAVGRYTRFVMNGAVVGELGACSGLYNLLHLYERYRRGEYRHPTLQLESSEVLYRGAALYSWQP